MSGVRSGQGFWISTGPRRLGPKPGDVSEKVATKKVQKRGIRKVLKVLRKALEANYPDTYREMLRKWGWRKENY